MVCTALQKKEAYRIVHIQLVENTGFLSHSGIVFLALLLTHEMTSTERAHLPVPLPIPSSQITGSCFLQ